MTYFTTARSYSLAGRPQFIKSPSNTTAALGEIVTLECQADGHPTPIIKWYHNNVTVRMSATHSIVRNGSLRLVADAEEGCEHSFFSTTNEGSI